MTLPYFPGEEADARLGAYPAVFDRAIGSVIFDDTGRCYLDFYSAAGRLAYGHNNPAIKNAVTEYLAGDRISHSFDLPTVAKQEFLSAFEELICRPRRLDYRLFLGDADQHSVDSALSLARRLTGRPTVLCLTHQFHGVRLGAVGRGDRYESLVSSARERRPNRMDDGRMPDITWLDPMIRGATRGHERPAAVLVEATVDEAGVVLVDMGWLKSLAARCRDSGVLLIYDDRSVGCGRSGPFFSFERAGISPDIVCLSHCAGGFGLPLESTLVLSRLAARCGGEKAWESRGRDLSLIAATAALRIYWRDPSFAERCAQRGKRLGSGLRALAARSALRVRTRGTGLAHAVSFEEPGLADRVSTAALERGLLTGPPERGGGALLLTPPLTVTDDEVDRCLALLGEAMTAATSVV